MRVLVLTSSFPSDVNASAGVFVYKLCTHLSESNRLDVLTPGSTLNTTKDVARGFPVERFSYAPRRFQTLAQAPGGIPASLSQNPLRVLLVPLFLASFIYRALSLSKVADVIWANWAVCGFVGGFVRKISRVPLVTTLRGSDVNGLQQSWIKRKMLQMALSTSDSVVLVSETLREVVEHAFPVHARKLIVINNGVEQPTAQTSAREDNRENTRLRVLVVGSLTPNKNVCLAIEAARQIPMDLTIVGDGPERGMLEDMARGQSRSRVRFVGQVASEKVAEYMTASDIYLSCSKSEGRSNAMLEAMASGLAVVCSDIGGHRELVSHEISGLLFELDRIDSLLSSLGIVSDVNTRKGMGKAAQARIREMNLSWEACAARYQEVFEELTTTNV